MKKITIEQVVAMHSQLVQETGGLDGIRDQGALESSLMTPFMSFDGQDLYPSIAHKAARLCFALVKNHPFIDGNKRIGTHAMLVFLALNNIFLNYEQEELSDIVLQLAASEIDCDQLLTWIILHT